MAELRGQKWTKSEKILGINKVSINEFLRDHLDSYLTIQTKSVLRLPWLAVATTVWPKHLCSLYTFSLQVGPAQDAAAKCCSSFLRTWIVPPVRCWRESPWKDLLIYNPKKWFIYTDSPHEVDSNAASKQRNPVLVTLLLLRYRFMIDVPNRAYKFARAKLAREGSKGLWPCLPMVSCWQGRRDCLGTV